MLFRHHVLSAATISQSETAPLTIIDVQRVTPDHVRVYASTKSSSPEALAALTFPFTTLKQTSIAPAATAYDLECQSKSLEVCLPDASMRLAINPQDQDLLAGMNCLFAITTNPEPETLRIWAEYHAEHHDAGAAIILRRCNPEYGHPPEALEEAVRQAEGMDAFILVDCPIPLGDPEQPSIHEAMLAPDSPGKATMEQPAPDAWLSPLQELSVYEVLRHRYLMKARAVLKCEVEDILDPPHAHEGTIFDAVCASNGYFKFQGIRAYPWKVRGDQAVFSDHACIRFDGKSSESNWCCVPSRPAMWRPYRAGLNEPAEEGKSYSFYRFMGLKHPHLSAAQMAPKTSLVRDDVLVDLAAELGGDSPELPPEAATPAPAPAQAAKEYKNDRILIVTTMKNEGPFILEWIAYHRSIGVTDFVVYTNDCSDGTDTMFDLLQERGVVLHQENPYRETGEKPQHAAYHAAQHTQPAKDADWIICMDVDEYINIHVGDGTLHALFEAVPEATMWALTWRLFGNAEVFDYEDRFITEQFFRAAPHYIRKPHQAWGFKTLFRNLDHYKKFGVHRPKGLKPEYLNHIHWVNGSGQLMPENLLRTGWRSTKACWGYDMVTLNHYALRSAESFLVKRDRGRVNHVDRDQGMNYWFRMNHNAEEDRSVLDKMPRAHAEFEKLMSYPEIRAQHEASVKWHRGRIEELKAQPNYANLFNEMCSERMIKLSRLLHHFGNEVFLQGPDMVPEDFHLTHDT